MSSIEYLCKSAGLRPARLSKQENLLLDTYLLCNLVQEFNNTISHTHPINNTTQTNKDFAMTHGNIIHLILQDLLKTNDYTITGVATYSDVPEDVIYDIAIGNNLNPSLDVTRKIVELHRTARSDVYRHVMRKIINDYSLTENAG